jgi:predicted nucleic acid-binding protein
MDVLDTNLLIEGKVGLTTIFNVIEYPPATRKCRILFPRKEDYLKAIEIMVKLREIGKPSPAMDVIIAAMCIRRNLKLLTKDIHFLSIKEVEPDFIVELFE